MIVELGHEQSGASGLTTSGGFSGLRGVVCESVGPIRHEVSVPFHDSQVRGIALLIQTGWDQRWNTDEYWEPGPFLGEQLIFRILRSGIRLVGVDFPVSDRSSHTRLITGGKIPIVENLGRLSTLPRVGFRFSALPLEPGSAEALVVRAFAEII